MATKKIPNGQSNKAHLERIIAANDKAAHMQAKADAAQAKASVAHAKASMVHASVRAKGKDVVYDFKTGKPQVKDRK